jgi:hypothetical protein
MTRRKNSASYPTERKVLDAVLQRGKSLRVNFPRYGDAVRFRQKCYEFRRSLMEEMAQEAAEEQRELETAMGGNISDPFDPSAPPETGKVVLLENPTTPYEGITISVEQDQKYMTADFSSDKPKYKPNKDEPGWAMIHVGSPIGAVAFESIVDPDTGEEIEL